MTFESAYKGIADYYRDLGPQTNTECDNALHGFGCQCLKGKDSEGEVVDEVLVELQDALDEALSKEEEAEGMLEAAQEEFDITNDRVNRLVAAIKKHNKDKV